MKNTLSRTPLSLLLALCLGLSGASLAGAQTTADDGMDRSVAPGADFNQFANGGWLKATTIPDDKAGVGVFDILYENASLQVRKIVEDAGQAAPGSEARKVGDYYNALLNVAAIDKLGLAPLKADFNAINHINDKKALALWFGAHLRADVDPLNDTNFYTDNLFGLWVAQGLHDYTSYTGYLLQGGLGLPDRDYYLSDNPHMIQIRLAYQASVAAALKLAKLPDPDNAAKRIVELETRIAAGHVSRTDSEDSKKADNKWSKADFEIKAPGLDWRSYFGAAGLAARQDMMVWQPGAVTATAALVQSVPLATWKDYLRFHVIKQHVSALPQPFFDESFRLNAAISGVRVAEPRWKYAVRGTDAALGDVIGKIYVQENFSPEAKARVKELVANLMSAFDVQVSNIQWMDPATRAEALAKIKTFYVGVGYPDKWRDYSGLKIVAGDAYGNLDRARLFHYHNEISKFGKPVDVTEWCMTPQTVNAVNMPLQNAINFPAAILKAPFFDLNASDAANYGAIGAIIGHEISHSFDHTGSTIDSKGQLRDWWTSADLEHFEHATQTLVDQYSAYRPFTDLTVNGKQTLDENIADLTGLTASLNAYHAALTRSGVTPDAAHDQEFFLAFAKAWRAKIRDQALRAMIVTDGHAPPQYRLLTVRNLDAWYGAFDVKAGEPLYLAPEARVRIW